MRTLKIQTAFIWLCAGLLLAPACRKNPSPAPQPPAPPPPGPVLTLPERLANQIQRSLDTTQYGFALTIYDSTAFVLSRSGGFSRRPQDGQAARFTDSTFIHMASISKTLTAMAVLRVLGEKGISVQSRIEPFLPADWVRGPGVASITFEELMTHQSGLRDIGAGCTNSTSNNYASLREVVQQGGLNKNYCYQNSNFGLFRVLLPVMTGTTLTGNLVQDNLITETAYVDIMQRYLFQKAGVAARTQWLPGDALLYDFPATTRPGFNTATLTGSAGGLGWSLSTRSVAQVVSHLSSATDERLLLQAEKQNLLLRRLGCFTLSTSNGTAYWHDGLWYTVATTQPRGMRSVWMKLPAKLTLVLVVNAVGAPSPVFPVGNLTIQQFVRDAYDAVQ